MSVARRSIVLALAMAGLGLSAASGEVLLSSFEENLDSSIGVPWQVNFDPAAVQLSTAYVTDGATEGIYALQVEHSTEWSMNFQLNSPDLLPLVANHDFLEIDTAPLPDAAWRQVFVVMHGGIAGGEETVPWNATQFDLDLAQGGTIALDLNGTGLREGAQSLLNEDAWWITWLIFQGGDTSGADRITTTFDNIRFTGGTTVLLGDVNMDGVVNGLDVDPFVGLVTGGTYQAEGDMNEDGVVNGLDVDPFVATVVGGGTVAVPEPSMLFLALIALGGFCALRCRK
jgi:hypothetical protein